MFSIKDKHFSELVKGALSSFLIKGVAALVTFIFYLMVGRFFGAQQSGVFFICLTILTVFSVLGKAGLENFLLRFVASNYRAGNWDLINDAFSKSVKIVIFVSIFLTVIVIILSDIIADVLLSSISDSFYIKVMALGIVPLSLSAVIAQAVQGLKQIKKHAFLLNLSVPLFAFLFSILAIYYKGFNGLIHSYITAIYLTLIVAIIFWKQAVGTANDFKNNVTYKEILSSSVPLFWVSVMQMIVNWTSFVTLGIFSSESDVGVFGMAIKVVTLLGFVLMAVNSIAAPKFADMYKHGDYLILEKLCRKTTLMLVLLTAPIVVFMLVFPGFLMGLFGAEFKSYGLVLQILVTGQFINIASGSVGMLLIMSGNEKLMRNNLIIAALLCVPLNVVLVPMFGVYGAAIASSLVMIMQNIIAVLMAKKYLNIVTIPKFPCFKR